MASIAAPNPINVVPTTRFTQRENTGRISSPLARAASAAYRLKDVSDNIMKITVRIRNCGSSAAPWSMNCGNSAVKKMVALGLVAAVRNAAW